jgi:ComEC/Rec2-related protein
VLVIFCEDSSIGTIGEIVKEEEVNTLFRITDKKESVFISGQGKDRLHCRQIKFISNNKSDNSKKTYIIQKERILKKEVVYSVRGVLFESSYLEHVNFLRYTRLEKREENRHISEIFDNLDINIDSKSFLKAFIFGIKDDLSDDYKNIFIQSGTMHLFAVSGLHIGCLYVALMWLFKLFGNKQNFSMIVTLFLLVGYLYLVNFSVSSTRAYLMLCVWVISKLLGLKVINISVISIAGLFLLLHDTDTFQDIGFIISITVVFTIVWCLSTKDHHTSRKNGILNWILKLIQVNYSAFWGSFLILAKCFSLIVPVSLLSNLLILPFISIIMPISILSVFILSFIDLKLLVYLLDFIVLIIINTCKYFSELSWSYFNWHNSHSVNFSEFYIFITFLILSYKTNRSLFSCFSMLPTMVFALLIF